MIDIPGVYVGRFKTDPNNRPALMTRANVSTYTDDNWANVESTGTIWRYNAKTGEWVDTGLEEILVEEVTGTKEIVAEGTVPWNLQGLNVYGKSTQVSTTGAQLFDRSKLLMNHGYDLDGVLKTYTGRAAIEKIIINPGEYIFSNSPYAIIVCSFDDSDTLLHRQTSISSTFTVPESTAYIGVTFYEGVTDVSELDNVMLNSGTIALPWEPYTGGQPSPSPDYPQEIVTAGSDGTIDIAVSDSADQSQQLSISTPNGLPGIPISSGGNYTDASGQQWVCDEVDFEKGVYRKTVGVIENYQSESVNEPYMSTTGQLSIGAKVIYHLSQQEETPLTDSQLQAYKALMSYDDTTVISTDEDISGMSAKVVTDVISKNAWFDPYAELALYYKALAGFASLEDLPMPHSRESSLVRKLLDSSYELGFTVTENSSRNERYLWDLINGTTSMLANVPKSDTEKFLHVMIGGTVEEYPKVDTELDYWMDKCVNYMNTNGSIRE